MKPESEDYTLSSCGQLGCRYSVGIVEGGNILESLLNMTRR